MGPLHSYCARLMSSTFHGVMPKSNRARVTGTKSLGARAARIQVQHAVAFPLFRLMSVPADHGVESGSFGRKSSARRLCNM